MIRTLRPFSKGLVCRRRSDYTAPATSGCLCWRLWGFIRVSLWRSRGIQTCALTMMIYSHIASPEMKQAMDRIQEVFGTTQI